MYVEKFCCCSLRSGTIIYAAIMLGFTLSNLIYSSIKIREDLDTTSNYISIAASITGILTQCSLIYGAVVESRHFMLPWLILACFFYVILNIYCLIFMFVEPALILFLLISIPFWYLWVCVLSFHQSLDPRNPHHVPTLVQNQEGLYPSTAVMLNQNMENEKVILEPLPGIVAV